MKSGAPIGNKNAEKKNHLFGDALRRIYAQKKRDITKSCYALIDKAESGDTTALRELADRLDGKVPQAIMGTGEDGDLKLSVTVRYVDGNSSRPPG